MWLGGSGGSGDVGNPVQPLRNKHHNAVYCYQHQSKENSDMCKHMCGVFNSQGMCYTAMEK